MSHLGVSFYVIAIFILGVSDKGGNKVCVNTTLYNLSLSLCICVCVDPPKAACAPLFQMTLFTDITQPP